LLLLWIAALVLKADVLEMCAVPLIMYAIQHYLSIAGSLILIPLIIVPAMGGTPVSQTYIPPVL
jgi:xanthine/uracil permease